MAEKINYNTYLAEIISSIDTIKNVLQSGNKFETTNDLINECVPTVQDQEVCVLKEGNKNATCSKVVERSMRVRFATADDLKTKEKVDSKTATRNTLMQKNKSTPSMETLQYDVCDTDLMVTKDRSYFNKQFGLASKGIKSIAANYVSNLQEHGVNGVKLAIGKPGTEKPRVIKADLDGDGHKDSAMAFVMSTSSYIPGNVESHLTETCADKREWTSVMDNYVVTTIIFSSTLFCGKVLVFEFTDLNRRYIYSGTK
ncbi:hypothetical protein KKA47_01280 [bacterium]|nr:hypothetical protein [bacterium]